MFSVRSHEMLAHLETSRSLYIRVFRPTKHLSVRRYDCTNARWRVPGSTEELFEKPAIK